MLVRPLPRERWAAFLVTPSTLLRWNRELVARRGTYPARARQRGRDPEIVDLVVRTARENPRWVYLRIVGECRKLGSAVAVSYLTTRQHQARRTPPQWTQPTGREMSSIPTPDTDSRETKEYLILPGVHISGYLGYPNRQWSWAQLARDL